MRRPKHSQKKIILASIALDKMAGGLEKNIVHLANEMQGRGYRVYVVTFDLPEAVSFYPLHPDVEWHKMGVSVPHQKISFKDRADSIGKIRRFIKEHALKAPLIVFHHGILIRMFIASFGLATPLICSERHSVSIYQHTTKSKWNVNFLLLFMCRAITVQFESYKKKYPMLLRRRIRAIPNSISQMKQVATPDKADELGRFRILCVARLGYQKNISVLIEAFSKLAQRYPLWDVHLVGDGEEEGRLKAIVKERDLEGRVIFHGKQENIPDYLKAAHIFCLPSRWEGFPNALAEALSMGLPCVGFAGCDGVSDLIVDGGNGVLAQGNGRIDTLSQKIEGLVQDNDLRQEMGAAAARSVMCYAPDSIYDQWDSLIREYV